MSLRKITVLALLLSLLLTACGGVEKASAPAEDSESEGNYEWTADFYNPELDIASLTATSDGEYVYFTTVANAPSRSAKTDESEKSDINLFTEYYRWNIGKDEPEKINITGSIVMKNSNDTVIQPDGFGNLYILLSDYIAKHDSDGNELYFGTTDSLFNIKTAVDEEGRLFVVSTRTNTDTIYIFNTDCTLASKTRDTHDLITNTSDGSIYLSTAAYSDSQENILKISFDDRSPEIAYKNSVSCSLFASYLDEGFLMNKDQTLYLYNTETEKLEELFLWANLGIDYNDVQSLCVLNDGSIVVFLGEGEKDECTHASGIVHIYKSNLKKTVITLGTFTASRMLIDYVTEFNKVSKDSRIEIRQYYDKETDSSIGGTGYQDAVTRFNLDIMSGNCPDILNLDYDSLHKYVSKGLFEDLTPYINASGLNIIDNISSKYTFNGVLAALPCIVQLHTLVCRSEDVDYMTGWTLEEMMDFTEAHSDETVFYANAENMLEYCLKFNQSLFVDWETYTCSFECEEFYRILEFCSLYDGMNNAYSHIMNAANYDAMIYEVPLCTVCDFIILTQLLEDEDITFIGFPTESGSGTELEEMGGSYAISSSSENKDMAWEFIEYGLANPISASSAVSQGYPVISEVREEHFKEEMSEPWIEDEDEKNVNRRSLQHVSRNNHEMIYYVPFEEELQPIRDLLEISESPKSDSTILDIILENAADYFSGEKSAEEVAKQIQSRVMIYLGEIK